MLARPDPMCRSAHAKSKNGMTHSRTDTTMRCAHAINVPGSDCRVTTLTTARAMAPESSRPRTTWPGDRPSKPTLMNRKLAPHAAANNTNWASTNRPLTCVSRTVTTLQASAIGPAGPGPTEKTFGTALP
jgi:hypothetical protein